MPYQAELKRKTISAEQAAASRAYDLASRS